MATVVTTALEDDLDGSPAAETVRFGLEDERWEIDLSSVNAARLRAEFALFVEHAREVRTKPLRVSRPVALRRRSAATREWLKEHGFAVGDRGRIPGQLIDKYEAAQRG